jgi:Spy/CpxP family protein refolding chaperone
MLKLKLVSAAAALTLAASIVAPAVAHADGYRYARGPYVYGEFGAPYPYYSKKELRALERADRNLRRAYERADRAARRQQEREARAYNKLMRAYDRYYSRYGYPYEFGYELGPAPYRYNRGG